MLDIKFTVDDYRLRAEAAQIKTCSSRLFGAGYEIRFGDTTRFNDGQSLTAREGWVAERYYDSAEEAESAKANFERLVEFANSQRRCVGDVVLTRLDTLVKSDGDFQRVLTPKLQLASGVMTYCNTAEEAVKLMDDLMPLAYIAGGKEYGGELKVRLARVGNTLYAQTAAMPERLRGTGNIGETGAYVLRSADYPAMEDRILALPGRDRDSDGKIVSFTHDDEAKAKLAEAHFIELIEGTDYEVARVIGRKLDVTIERNGRQVAVFTHDYEQAVELTYNGVEHHAGEFSQQFRSMEEAKKTFEARVIMARLINGEVGEFLKVRITRCGKTLYAQAVKIPENLRGKGIISEDGDFRISVGIDAAIRRNTLLLAAAPDDRIVQYEYESATAARKALGAFVELLENATVIVGGDRLKVGFTQSLNQVTVQIINVTPDFEYVVKDSWGIIPAKEPFVGGTFLNVAHGLATGAFPSEAAAVEYVANITKLVEEANDYEEEHVSGPKLGAKFIRIGRNLKVEIKEENLEQSYYDDDWTLQCRSKVYLAGNRLYVGVGKDNYTYTSVDRAKLAFKRFVGLAKEANSEVVGDNAASRLRVKFWFNGSNLSAQVLKQDKSVGGKTIAQLGGFSIKTAGGPGIYGKHLYIRGSNRLRDSEIAKHEYASAKEAQEAFSAFDAMITAVNHPDAATYLYHCNNGLLEKVERVNQFTMSAFKESDFAEKYGTGPGTLALARCAIDVAAASQAVLTEFQRAYQCAKTAKLKTFAGGTASSGFVCTAAQSNEFFPVMPTDGSRFRDKLSKSFLDEIYGADYESLEKRIFGFAYRKRPFGPEVFGSQRVVGKGFSVWLGRLKNVLLAWAPDCESVPNFSHGGRSIKPGFASSLRRNKLVLAKGDDRILSCSYPSDEQAEAALKEFVELARRTNA